MLLGQGYGFESGLQPAVWSLHAFPVPCVGFLHVFWFHAWQLIRTLYIVPWSQCELLSMNALRLAGNHVRAYATNCPGLVGKSSSVPAILVKISPSDNGWIIYLTIFHYSPFVAHWYAFMYRFKNIWISLKWNCNMWSIQYALMFLFITIIKEPFILSVRCENMIFTNWVKK